MFFFYGFQSLGLISNKKRLWEYIDSLNDPWLSLNDHHIHLMTMASTVVKGLQNLLWSWVSQLRLMTEIPGPIAVLNLGLPCIPKG